MKKRAVRIVSYTFLAISIIILLNSFQSITGFVIFESASQSNSFLAAFWFIAAALTLMLTTATLEEKVAKEKEIIKNLGAEDRQNIKSFRRYLKKSEHKNLEYSEVMEKYLQAKKEYFKSLSRGLIKRNEKPLEFVKEYASRHQEITGPRIEIYVSEKVLEKIAGEKDRAVEKEYFHEVQQIARNPKGRPTEKLGPFLVSPRGGKKMRIAWHTEGDTIYIDDIFPKHGEDYEHFATGASKNKTITLEDYPKKFYRRQAG